MKAHELRSGIEAIKNGPPKAPFKGVPKSSNLTKIAEFATEQEAQVFIDAHKILARPHETFQSGVGLHWIAVSAVGDRMAAANLDGVSGTILEDW